VKRILIADDHVTVRSGLRAILEARAGWEVVAEARDGNEAVAAAIAKRPDVAIVEYSMPLLNGIEVTRRIKELQPVTEVLMFTIHDSSSLACQAFQAGVSAYLLKSNANKMLMVAVECLMARKPFYAGGFSSDKESMPKGKCEPTQILSPRERTVVKLIAEGYTNKGISAILSLSIKTTEAHRATAMRKLGIRSIAGLVQYAVRNNFLVP
jgi:DNA-binding NarL/FixJ family response regulator